MLTKIEILVTVSIVSFVFVANLSLLLYSIARFNGITNDLQNFIQLESNYEAQFFE